MSPKYWSNYGLSFAKGQLREIMCDFEAMRRLTNSIVIFKKTQKKLIEMSVKPKYAVCIRGFCVFNKLTESLLLLHTI